MKYVITTILCFIQKLAFLQSPPIYWQETIGGFNQDYLKSISLTTDGGYILGGESYSGSNGDKTENRIGDSDFWVIKLDAVGNIEWQNTIGGTSIEKLNFVEPTPDGGYVLGGYSLSGISGDKLEGNLDGSYDYWVLKLDAAGNIQWQNTIGGDANDKANCITQTSDGGFIVGGESESGISGDKTENTRGGDDYWIVQLDINGNIVWQKTIGGNSFDGLYSINSTTDGGYILGGYSISGISGEKSDNTFGGSYDYWILKLDSAGNIAWQKTIGGTAGDKLRKIRQTDDGGYIAGGTSASDISGYKNEDSYSDDYWILKLDSSGNIVWQNTISGLGADVFNDVVETADGGYLVGGSSTSVAGVDKSESRIGASSLFDYWIIKLDSVGNIVWENTIGGNKSDNFSALLETAEGDIVLAGSSLSAIYADKTEANWNPKTDDWWIVQLSAEAEECAAPGGLFADNITSTSTKLNWTSEPLANVYKVYYRITDTFEWTKSNTISNFIHLVDLSPSTTYEYKIKCLCDSASSDFSAVETFSTLPFRETNLNDSVNWVNIYPNPTTGKIIIENYSESFFLSVIIYNLSGKVVYENSFSMSPFGVDLTNLESGIYYITIILPNETITSKIIKI